jgi:hypothetical protein
MSTQALVKKLRLQAGMGACVYNSPDEYLSALGQIPDRVNISEKLEGTFDFVHIFVNNHAELDNCIDEAIKAVKYDGMFWISYPKGSAKVKTDLNRDTIWKAMLVKGIRPVSLISIDEVWSAIRFRPSEKVGDN